MTPDKSPIALVASGPNTPIARCTEHRYSAKISLSWHQLVLEWTACVLGARNSVGHLGLILGVLGPPPALPGPVSGS
jgi:hypothetical protein